MSWPHYTDWLSVGAAEQDWRRLFYIKNHLRRLEDFSRLLSHGRMPALARRGGGLTDGCADSAACD
jgi:hypothetical protein